MQCPKCASQEDKVIDSRASREGLAIRRRRECTICGTRFTTYEEIERPTGLMVRKRDGRLEEFSREKLLSGIRKACQKRPVPLEAMEGLAERIHNEVASAVDHELNYRDIGGRVMDGLRTLDKVAYIRYASVYRGFEEVGEFMDEIKKLEKPHDTLTYRLPGV